MISLHLAFAKLRRRANPDAVFARNLKQKITHPSASPVTRLKLWVMRIATALLVTVPAAGIGSAAYAYYSPEVLPQHPLYGVRLALESVEERLVPVEQKQLVLAKHLARRQEEAEQAQAKGLSLDDRFIEDVIHRTESLVSDPSGRVDPAQREEASAFAEGLHKLMDQVKDASPEEKLKLNRAAYNQAERLVKQLRGENKKTSTTTETNRPSATKVKEND